jgi:HAD superfamily phosphoserine phosphatase-like hydrolase
MRVFLLRGFSREDMERLAMDFVNEVLLGASNAALQSRLEKHLRVGDRVQISSGGIGVYLRMWANKHGIWEVDATELEFRDGRCKGFLLGADCLYEEKVKRLENRMELNTELGTLERVVYSDSITDLPLLKWADEAWVISYEKSRAWVNNYKLKELVIGRNNAGLEV